MAIVGEGLQRTGGRHRAHPVRFVRHDRAGVRDEAGRADPRGRVAARVVAVADHADRRRRRVDDPRQAAVRCVLVAVVAAAQRLARRAQVVQHVVAVRHHTTVVAVGRRQQPVACVVAHAARARLQHRGTVVDQAGQVAVVIPDIAVLDDRTVRIRRGQRPASTSALSAR